MKNKKNFKNNISMNDFFSSLNFLIEDKTIKNRMSYDVLCDLIYKSKKTFKSLEDIRWILKKKNALDSKYWSKSEKKHTKINKYTEQSKSRKLNKIFHKLERPKILFFKGVPVSFIGSTSSECTYALKSYINSNILELAERFIKEAKMHGYNFTLNKEAQNLYKKTSYEDAFITY